MPTKRSQHSGTIAVQWEDIMQFLARVRKDEDRSIRVIAKAAFDALDSPRTITVIQVCAQVNGTVWIEYQAEFEWTQKSDRTYLSALLIALHRAYHAWGEAAFTPTRSANS